MKENEDHYQGIEKNLKKYTYKYKNLKETKQKLEIQI